MKTAGLLNLSQKAVHTRELVAALRTEISFLKTTVLKEAHERETTRIKAENEALRKEIEHWQNKLIKLEIRNGVPQIALPKASEQPLKAAALPVQKVINPSEPAKDASGQPPHKIQKTKKAEQVSGDKKPSKAVKEAPPSDDNKPVDVSRLDLRIGCIVAVEKHKDADSLYVEQVEVGEEKPRTVVSGLVKHVPLEEMKNRMVVLLCNLKPAKMRGVTSEAMVMCASTPEKVEILSPPEGALPGDKVTCEGYSAEPDAVLNPKKKVFEQVSPDLKTDGNCLATYKGIPFTVLGKGVVRSATLANVQIK